MALSYAAPQQVAGDLMPLKEIAALMRDTPHPASVTTLKRRIKKYKMRTVRIDGADYVSWSDMLDAQHAEATRNSAI